MNEHAAPAGDVVPIGDLRWRQQATVRGRVRSMRIEPVSGVVALECVVADGTGGLYVLFPRRRAVEGVKLGCTLRLEGIVEGHRGHLAMVDPVVRVDEAEARAG
jgi:hypothetical protein